MWIRMAAFARFARPHLISSYLIDAHSDRGAPKCSKHCDANKIHPDRVDMQNVSTDRVCVWLLVRSTF